MTRTLSPIGVDGNIIITVVIYRSWCEGAFIHSMFAVESNIVKLSHVD